MIKNTLLGVALWEGGSASQTARFKSNAGLGSGGRYPRDRDRSGSMAVCHRVK